MKDMDRLFEDLERFTGQDITVNFRASVIGWILAVVGFVFMAVALYTIAKRRGIFRPWLAWIPVINGWMVGCISDQYRSVIYRQRRNRRSLLLWLNIGATVMWGLSLLVAWLLVLRMWRSGLLDPAVLETMNEAELMAMMQQILLPTIGLLLVAMAYLALQIVYLVFFYLALSDIFKSCDPGRATLFVVLSIAVGVGLNLFLGIPLMLMPGIFLFACRNGDWGMPRRQSAEPQM